LKRDQYHGCPRTRQKIREWEKGETGAGFYFFQRTPQCIHRSTVSIIGGVVHEHVRQRFDSDVVV